MATLNIGGKRVTVDDSFLTMTPEQQAATVEEIAGSLGGGAQPAQAQPQPAADQPWYSKLGQAADDIVRIGANAATFGMADRLAGFMEGTGKEAERAKTQAARDRAGSAGLAAEIGGTLAPAGILAKGVGAITPAMGLAGRTASNVAQGAALGAADAAGNDRDIAKGAAFGAAAGGLGGLAGEAISAGVGKVAGAFNKAPKVASNTELRAAADAAYKAADDAGLIFTPQGMSRAQAGIQEDLSKLAFLPANQPKVAAVLAQFDEAVANNNTLTGLDQLRQMASNAFDPQNPASNKMLGRIIGRIDDLVTNPATGEVIAKDAAAGASAIKEARDFWSRLKKSETLDRAVLKAERRAASTGSGGNSDNAIRQNVRAILDAPSKTRGWSADELAAAETLVRGTKSQNLARALGKLSPQGNGLALLLHGTGGVMSGGATLPLAAVGAGAKVVADRATPKNVEQLSRVLRAGGDASATRAAPNAVQRLAESKRDALVRLLMAGGLTAAR
jgi:hypothetical protein